ncbi:MAG: nucleoside-triphosphatase [Rectinemataceae bacterium]
MRNLILVTGSMRTGKTSLCKALFSILEKKSACPFAIIEENRRDERGIPLTIVLHDLGRKELLHFASRTASQGDDYLPFNFNPEAFVWVLDKLKEAIAQGCGPVILDEIGALEAKRGGGFLMDAVWAMDHGEGSLVLTLRPELEENLLERLSSMTKIGPVERFRLGSTDPEKLALTVADYVLSIASPGNELYIQSMHL